MLYHILSYNPNQEIAEGIEASLATSGKMPMHRSVWLHSPTPLLVGRTYSFVPTDKFVDGYYIRGTIDVQFQSSSRFN